MVNLLPGLLFAYVEALGDCARLSPLLISFSTRSLLRKENHGVCAVIMHPDP